MVIIKGEIELEDIMYFQNEYELDADNLLIENKIRKMGVMKASIDEKQRDNYKFEFNIEVPDVKIYNQLDSHQCDAYAFLRVVKDILRTNSDLDVACLDLSSSYIHFFDKLEKANSLYNDLINAKHLTLSMINKKTNHYIGSYGTFHFCREIVNKYGLVPTSSMSEANTHYRDYITIELLQDKIKTDALSLLKLTSKTEKMAKKKELMLEVYTFLAKIYGNPPHTFTFKGEKFTPQEFKCKYLKDALDDYVTVTSLDKEVLYSSYSFIPNIYLSKNEKIKHLSLDKMKEVVVKQLKDGISVWFSAEESTTLDYDENILDDTYYDIYNLLNIKNISKKRKFLLDIINYDHAMCITGALVKGSEVKQFKVDNSFGKHGEFKGQLLMTNSFFENCVITAIINKKYLK